MIQYKILSGETAGELSDAVNKAIGEGWAPLGGLAVHGEPHALKPWYFAQAMTRDGSSAFISETGSIAELIDRLSLNGSECRVSLDNKKLWIEFNSKDKTCLDIFFEKQRFSCQSFYYTLAVIFCDDDKFGSKKYKLEFDYKGKFKQ